MTQRDENGRLLPGAKLNPDGRAPKKREIERLFQEKLEKDGRNIAVEDLVAMAQDVEVSVKERKACYELALAYAYGKPTQRREISATINSIPKHIQDMTPEELDAEIDEARKNE